MLDFTNMILLHLMLLCYIMKHSNAAQWICYNENK